MQGVMKHSAIWLTTSVRYAYHAIVANDPRKRLKFVDNAIASLEVAREMISSQLGPNEKDRRVA